MQIFVNGKQRFHSFIEFYAIHLKNQEVKILSQWHFKPYQELITDLTMEKEMGIPSGPGKLL